MRDEFFFKERTFFIVQTLISNVEDDLFLNLNIPIESSVKEEAFVRFLKLQFFSKTSYKFSKFIKKNQFIYIFKNFKLIFKNFFDAWKIQKWSYFIVNLM